MEEGLQNIKQNYLEDLGTEMSEEEILNMFTQLQLINYKEEIPNIFLVIFIILVIIVIAIACIILINTAIKNKKQAKKVKKESNFKNV